MNQLYRYLLALLVLGILCGVVGAFFTFVLAGVEHLAFGFTTGTFAEAVTRVPAWHRFAAVVIAGGVVAGIWYFLRKRGPRIPSPAQIYKGERVTGWWMLGDTTLQVVNVAAGGSIGREGAPRQMGALYGARVANWLKLDEETGRLLIACGTGAGLAAIYNVPIGGCFFAIETIIGFAALRAGVLRAMNIVLSTLGVSYLATVIARVVVPDRPTYTVDWETMTGPFFLIALVLGPLVGVAGYGFSLLMERARERAPKGKAILWAMPLCYLLLAGLAVPLPLVLGNGHAMAQSLLDGQVPLLMAGLLILAKPIATLLTVRAGATGGVLTPSLSTGAAIGFVLAALCSMIWPVPATALAILAAAAFLGGATKAYLTAGVLAVEFTGAGPALWGPTAVAVAGTWAVAAWLKRRGKH